MGEITAVLDATQLHQRIQRLGETSMRKTKEAARVSALNIQREARSRARRQLINPTGVLEAGVLVNDDREEVGYVVRSVYRDARQMFNVPIWVERGTKRGDPGSHDSAPRPFFWPSVQLEIPAHERRVAEAMEQSITQEGLGE